MKDFLAIAEILKPHGLRGAMKVAPLYQSVVNYKSLKRVYITEKNIEANVVQVKSLNNFYSIELDLFNNIDNVETLRGEYIFVDKNDYPEYFNGVLFSGDIVGFEVKTLDGDTIGFITSADEYGASTVLTISNNGQSYMIPMIDDVIWLSDDKTCMEIDYNRFLEVRV